MSGSANAAAANGHTSLRDVMDCPVSRRSVYLSMGLRLGESDFAFILYHYLVQEFRYHPNKKRAIFIYDRCLNAEGSGRVDENGLNNIDLSLNYSRGRAGQSLSDLQDNVAQCKQLHAQYVSQSWFNWLSGSAAATKPPAWLFDHLTENVIDNDKQLTVSLLGNIGRGGQIAFQEGYKNAKRNLPALKRELAAEGFDTQRLGLDSMVLS